MNNSSSSSITALAPGGVVTTQNISTVIKPKGNNNSMQFVKIQTPELSKKAVEQIRVAQESKISKEKIKEVEEEWQNNLLNWKSKRRQQFVGIHDQNENEQNNQFDASDNGNGRKIKTFAEMIEQRARAGNRKLNFHLERYIGSGEDDDDDDVGLGSGIVGDGDRVDSAHQQPTIADSITAKDELDHSHQSARNSQFDYSDCEPHSSLSSSGHNQMNSKSPSSSLDSPAAEIHRHNNDDHYQLMSLNPPKSPEETVKTCDTNESVHSMIQNSHSISVVASSETDQLNSTFKQGINKLPSIHSNGKFKPLLDVDTRTNEVSAKIEDESDNSAFEGEDEEEEQEEEQKQLQRIAFVAKLKAFEKMTKPSTQEPKFVPSRTVKAPPPPPPFPAKAKQQIDIAKKIPNLKDNVASIQPIIRNDKIHSSSNSSIATSSVDLKSEDSVNESTTPASKLDCDDRLPADNNNYPLETHLGVLTRPSKQLQRINSDDINSPLAQSQQTIQPAQNSTPQVQHQPLPPDPSVVNEHDVSTLGSRVSQIHLNSEPPKTYSDAPLPPPISNANIIGLTRCNSNGSHVSSQSDQWHGCQLMFNNNGTNTPPLNENTQSTNYRQKSYVSPGAQKSIPHPATFITRDRAHPQQTQSQSGYPLLGNNINFNHRSSNNIQTQPLPEPPKRTTTQLPQPPSQPGDQRKPPLREDKDRTVLSVSGKKRCSSCKEELGRGAAAFVVESLSLVYHTNCFRCSVCHVNLSNGFRGVDVRVHAGALHCQNCYSKDGLNYSRV